VTDRLEPQLGNLDGIAAAASPRRVEVRPANNRPRKPWLALAVAVLFGPVAFAYAGAPMLGIGLVLIELGVAPVAGRTGVVQSLAGFAVVLAILLIATIASLVLPWLVARKHARIYAPQWFNRWYLYVVFFLLTVPPMSYLFLHKEQFFGFATYRVPSGSMLPTIGLGDLILADTRPDVVANPRVGDIVVYWGSMHPDQLYVRRVVALPGQHVVIDAKGLAVDGTREDRTHLLGSDLPSPAFAPVDLVLGADQYYLMADNRANAYDSRVEGPYRRAQLRGKVTTDWYSEDWSRVGSLQQP
jgi:signal peptidase I